MNTDRFRVTGYKNDMSFKDLPYFKMFSPDERLAALAGFPYHCQICKKVAFYSDVMNIPDFLNLVIVCTSCKDKYQKAFNEKRIKLRENEKTRME